MREKVETSLLWTSFSSISFPTIRNAYMSTCHSDLRCLGLVGLGDHLIYCHVPAVEAVQVKLVQGVFREKGRENYKEMKNRGFPGVSVGRC